MQHMKVHDFRNLVRIECIARITSGSKLPHEVLYKRASKQRNHLALSSKVVNMKSISPFTAFTIS